MKTKKIIILVLLTFALAFGFNAKVHADAKETCENNGYKWESNYRCIVRGLRDVNINNESACHNANNGKYLWKDGACYEETENDRGAYESNSCSAQGGYMKDNGSCNTGSTTITIGLGCSDEEVRNILSVVKKAYTFMKYITPIILIVMGSIDFLKVTWAKEEDIQKHKKRFINRIILAIFVFIAFSLAELLTNLLGSANVEDSTSWISCWKSL